MQILSRQTNIDFIGRRHLLALLSLILTAASIFVWVQAGDTKFGVDFRGGFEYVIRFNGDVQLKDLRDHLHEGGFGDALVQNFEGGQREFSIRLKADDNASVDATTKKVKAELAKIPGVTFEVLKEDYVGPIIGEQIKRDGVKAFIVSLIAILIYVSVQFNFSWAIGAVLALIHDAIIATGATILCKIELSGATLAAVLTITGYSVNDTIIIYDRIRENLREKERGGSAGKKALGEKLKSMSLMQVMNFSINQTLGRTIITSMTVMIVCFALWIFGNSSVSELAFTLLIGVIAGTYSTMFVACPTILALQKNSKEKK
jgi:preprotein translocase subunit SecF